MNMKNSSITKSNGFVSGSSFLPHDIKTISRMGKMLKILHILEATLTVGIIAFTVLRMINIFRQSS